jgi:hypothetical protein
MRKDRTKQFGWLQAQVFAGPPLRHILGCSLGQVNEAGIRGRL